MFSKKVLQRVLVLLRSRGQTTPCPWLPTWLYTPNSCGFFVTAPFLEQKALTANSENGVFWVLPLLCCLGLQIRFTGL